MLRNKYRKQTFHVLWGDIFENVKSGSRKFSQSLVKHGYIDSSS